MRFARAIAPALVIWLSGVACLLVCTTRCAEAATAQIAPERPCCHRSAAIEAEESTSAAGAVDELRGEPSLEGCCFLTARASLQVPVPKGSGATPAPAVVRVAFVDSGAAASRMAAAPSFPILNRGDTHLRCCVFLI